MKHFKIICTLFTVSLIVFAACSKNDKTTDLTTCGSYTYEGEIKTLIETHCNQISCHGAEKQPVLTYWAAVKVSVDNGSFEKEVITRRTMPEGIELKQADFDLFNCWLNSGAPEKSP
ncbi:MAG: hypothetical protein ACJAZ2_000096 [Glaciecola sp.]|jgi:hypothetical protein